MAFFARPQSAAVRIVDPNTHDEVKSLNKGRLFIIHIASTLIITIKILFNDNVGML